MTAQEGYKLQVSRITTQRGWRHYKKPGDVRPRPNLNIKLVGLVPPKGTFIQVLIDFDDQDGITISFRIDPNQSHYANKVENERRARVTSQTEIDMHDTELVEMLCTFVTAIRHRDGAPQDWLGYFGASYILDGAQTWEEDGWTRFRICYYPAPMHKHRYTKDYRPKWKAPTPRKSRRKHKMPKDIFNPKDYAPVVPKEQPSQKGVRVGPFILYGRQASIAAQVHRREKRFDHLEHRARQGIIRAFHRAGASPQQTRELLHVQIGTVLQHWNLLRNVKSRSANGPQLQLELEPDLTFDSIMAEAGLELRNGQVIITDPDHAGTVFEYLRDLATGGYS